MSTSDTESLQPLGSATGTGIADGIWDMLMVPNAATGTVLTSTGSIGKKRRHWWPGYGSSTCWPSSIQAIRCQVP